MDRHDLMVLATPRCGSEYFSQWMLKLYAFGWIGEWLAAGSLQEVATHLDLAEDWTLQEFAGALRTRKASMDGRIALKIMWDTFAWTQWKGTGEDLAEGIYSCLEKPQVVLLTRRDKVAQAVSLYKAQATGIWHAKDRVEMPEVPYDQGGIVKALLDILAGELAWRNWLQARGVESLTVGYEAFVADPRGHMSRILEHAGLDGSAAINALELPRNRRLADQNSAALRRQFETDRPDLAACFR